MAATTHVVSKPARDQEVIHRAGDKHRGDTPLPLRIEGDLIRDFQVLCQGYHSHREAQQAEDPAEDGVLPTTRKNINTESEIHLHIGVSDSNAPMLELIHTWTMHAINVLTG